MRLKSVSAWLCLFGTSIAPVALADSIDPASVFLPTDFEQYAPQNARDMVARIPGFRLADSRGQNESRGLGQATENVLINGQRVSSKSSSAADVLERIPASTVEKIELLEGATLDIPGLSGLVVNVIAKPTGVSGTWDYRARAISGRAPLLFGGEVTVSGQSGNVDWSFNTFATPRGSAGDGREQVFDASRNLLEETGLKERNLFPELGGSAGLRWTPSSGLIANLNFDYENSKRDANEAQSRVPVVGAPDRSEIQIIDEGTSAELSGDIEFGLANGRLKVIGVYAEQASPFTSRRERWNEFDIPVEEQFFRQNTEETEIILRSEYSWPGLGGTWDASLEGALNTLDSDAFLLAGDGVAPLTAQNIGDTVVEVEETRGEGFITHSRQFGSKLQAQLSLGVEVSELTSSGVNGQQRTFTRPKGGVTLSWTANEQTTVNARLNREVGQLDFFDFVSQLDLDDGENQVGNADIVPEQSWRAELEVERRFGAWGASNVLVFGEALEDIVDQVPIGTGEGPGNLETGSRFGVQFEGTVNFDPIGLNGAQLSYSALVQDSDVEDPLTGASRPINRDEVFEVELEFRHDIEGTNIAWGGDISPEQETDSYRLDSIRSRRDLPGRAAVFVEHKDLWGLTGRMELFRPFEDIEKDMRLNFTPDRTGTLSEIERTRIVKKPILIFELSGKF